MGRDPIVANHAFKHGLLKEDILHAWRNAYITRERIGENEREHLSIGPDRKGRDLQIVFAWNREEETWLIYHAMPLTKGVRNETEI